MIIAAVVFLYLLIGFLVACWMMKGESEDDSLWLIVVWIWWPVVLFMAAVISLLYFLNLFAAFVLRKLR